MTAFIKPLEPTLVDAAPGGDGWLHEVKQDGYRTQVHVGNGRARAFTRRGFNWSDRYAPIVAQAATLPCQSAVIDGEMIVQDADGRADFAALITSIGPAPHRLIYVAFDLLHLDGDDLRHRRLEERRDVLAALTAGVGGQLLFSEAYDGDGPTFFQHAAAHGLEGIVSKRKGSIYRSGPSRDWLKTKAFVEIEYEVIGLERTPTGGPSALLGKRDGRGLSYVGSAFVRVPKDQEQLLWQFAADNAARAAPVRGVDRPGVIWLKSGLLATAKHIPGDDFRHATLTGLRRV